jgi:hypothetical protein
MREQGDNMSAVGFEIKVLDIASKYLDGGERAEFYNGTLVLECIESNSRKIFSQLMREFDNKVNVSKVEFDTYLIDFIE